jgi:hypothetical protein
MDSSHCLLRSQRIRITSVRPHTEMNLTRTNKSKTTSLKGVLHNVTILDDQFEVRLMVLNDRDVFQRVLGVD